MSQLMAGFHVLFEAGSQESTFTTLTGVEWRSIWVDFIV